MKNIIFAVVLLLCSCKPKEFAGAYVANHKEGADTLIINQNHTYKHIFITNDNVRYVKDGNWEVGPENSWIDFENFDWHLKGFGINVKDTTNVSFWGVEIEYDLCGNPFFTIDKDRNLKYKAISFSN